MDSKTLFIILNPDEKSAEFCFATLERIKKSAAKRKWSVVILDDPSCVDDYPSLSVIILFGSSSDWVNKMLSILRPKGIRTILIGGVPSSFGEDVSSILCSGNSSVKDFVKYYYSCDRTKTALVGIDNTANYDQVRVAHFLEASASLKISRSINDVYCINSDSDNPIEAFLSKIKQYDSVLCTNIYIATYLLAWCRDEGICVPEDLFISGFGDSVICEKVSPTLTSASRSYSEIAEQIFDVWTKLVQNPQIMSLSIKVRGKIQARESTAFMPVPENMDYPIPEMVLQKDSSILEDIAHIQGLCNVLAESDALDHSIISGLINDLSFETIAEQNFASVGTIRYRLKKIYETAGVNSKKEFLRLLNQYISSDNK